MYRIYKGFLQFVDQYGNTIDLETVDKEEKCCPECGMLKSNKMEHWYEGCSGLNPITRNQQPRAR